MGSGSPNRREEPDELKTSRTLEATTGQPTLAVSGLGFTGPQSSSNYSGPRPKKVHVIPTQI